MKSFLQNTLLLIFRKVKEHFLILVLFFLFFLLFLFDLSCQAENIRVTSLGGWYYYIKNAMTYSIVFIGVHLLCGRYGRWFTLLFFVYFFFFAFLSLYLRFCFGMTLNKEIFFIIRASSVDEIMSFLKMHISFSYFFSFLAFVFIMFLCVIYIVKWLPTYNIKRKVVACGLLFICIGCIDNKVWNGANLFIAKASSLSLWRDYYNVKDFDEKMLAMVTNPQLPVGIESILHSDKGKATFGVIIIGESATRNHWSLYGYKRQTTPCMDSMKDELFVWNDVITAWPATTKALCYLMTMATLDRPNDFRASLVDIYKAAGYRVTYYCGQSRWGNAEGDIAKLFYHADKKLSLNDAIKRKYYDDDLLLFLNQHLASANESIPEIVFLHLCGSHYPPQFYIPKDWHPYPSGTMCNDYDNTIAFTDSILGKIYKMLNDTALPAFMLYISDHGESPSAEHWRALNDNDVWEIPMILWMSNDYKKLHRILYEQLKQAMKSTPPLQSDELFYGLCSIAGVSWYNFPKEKDFTQLCFQSKKKRILINREYIKRIIK